MAVLQPYWLEGPVLCSKVHTYPVLSLYGHMLEGNLRGSMVCARPRVLLNEVVDGTTTTGRTLYIARTQL